MGKKSKNPKKKKNASSRGGTGSAAVVEPPRREDGGCVESTGGATGDRTSANAAEDIKKYMLTGFQALGREDCRDLADRFINIILASYDP